MLMQLDLGCMYLGCMDGVGRGCEDLPRVCALRGDRYLQDPKIRDGINKLITAGILRVA